MSIDPRFTSPEPVASLSEEFTHLSMHPAFPKLQRDPSNYHDWSTKFIPALKSHIGEVSDIIDSNGRRDVAGQTSDDDDFVLVDAAVAQKKLEEWIERDKLALSKIQECVDGETVTVIANYTSAKSAWDKVKQIFSSISYRDATTIKYNMSLFKAQDGMCIRLWVDCMRRCYESVKKAMGDTFMTDHDFAYNLLFCLPLSYASTIETVNKQLKYFDASSTMDPVGIIELIIMKYSTGNPTCKPGGCDAPVPLRPTPSHKFDYHGQISRATERSVRFHPYFRGSRGDQYCTHCEGWGHALTSCVRHRNKQSSNFTEILTLPYALSA